MLDRLSSAERLRLMKFVCSFAWADLEIRPEERRFVARLIDRLGLSPAEEVRVYEWLEVPPSPESLDPSEIPLAHRRLFLEIIRGLIVADDDISPEERESYAIFEQLLA
jgi:hypothetical protein